MSCTLLAWLLKGASSSNSTMLDERSGADAEPIERSRKWKGWFCTGWTCCGVAGVATGTPTDEQQNTLSGDPTSAATSGDPQYYDRQATHFAATSGDSQYYDRQATHFAAISGDSQYYDRQATHLASSGD